MRLLRLEPVQVVDWWPRLRDEIASCCERSGGKYEPLDILTDALRERMQLWLALDDEGRHHAVGITEIIQYPRCKICALLAGTGENAQEWYRLIADMETWARAQGCRALEPRCRLGWQKRFKPLGYSTTHVIMEKTL